MLNLKKSVCAVAAAVAVMCTSAGVGTAAPNSPTAFFDAVKTAARTESPVVVWQVLPGTWRAQASGVLHTFAEAVPASMYDAGMGVFSKVITILATKKQFVLGSSMVKGELAKLTPQQRADAMKAYDALVSLGQAITKSDLRSAEALKKATVEGLLRTYGKQATTAALSLMRIPGNSVQGQVQGDATDGVRKILGALAIAKDMKISLVSESGESAIVKLTVTRPAGFDDLPPLPNMTPEIDMKKIDGAWVPEDMATAWPSAMQELNVQLDAFKAKTNQSDPQQAQQMQMGVQMMSGMANATLDPMLKAKTQAEFDTAINNTMAMFGGFMGGGPGGPGGP